MKQMPPTSHAAEHQLHDDLASAAAEANDAPSGGRRGSGDIEARIYQSIYEGVMNQRLSPGTRLPEAVLGKLFKVSRSTVRKVLQQLAHDHIVELRLNQQAVVATPTPEETRAIFETRQALEAAIVRLAAQRVTADDIAALRTQLAEEHAAMHRYDQPAWARLASSFHLKLAELSRNPVLSGYLAELVPRCSLIVALYEPPGNASCEHDEHGQIVDCLERGDADGAVALMQAHLATLERNVCLDRSGEEHGLARLLGLS
ncbi:GntR family transcriptional regulator [Pseudoduganella umbonata]|uniref:DNA-binding GntR family transcriptional regulator n=2 Tax=Pseudoduganella umbonata TaxID=864828 RepID=A0A7W5HDI2_9BURK|nr:GntR family transcriptional regulator [Pseudoduganella umbonata]MBB3222688.1 DNA-binding GntR family transcriptional regulator [Pseudoduganella umbonata]